MMNTDEKKGIVEDILGDFGFRLSWEVEDHVAEVKAYKVESRSDTAPSFWRKGSSHNGDPVKDITEAESYLEGYVKWDGCTELDQGSPHWCLPRDFRMHFDLLKHIYIRAFELMERTPDDPWDEPHDGLTVSLDPKFDPALMGTTVHPDQPPRAVYLLDALAVVLDGDLPAVAKIVQDVTREHGDRAPVFVESIVRPDEKKTESGIIIPGTFGGN